MKAIKELLVKSSCYTIIMMSVVYLFAIFSDLADKGITITRFAVLLGYGFLIAVAGLVKTKMSCGNILKTALHYIVLLSGFIFVFSFLGNMSNGVAAKLVVAITVFSVVYAAISLAVFFLRKHKNKFEGTDTPQEEKPTQKYTPLYGENK